MTAETVQRRGADIKVIMQASRSWHSSIELCFTTTFNHTLAEQSNVGSCLQRDKLKVETEALFTQRMPPITHEESDELMGAKI